MCLIQPEQSEVHKASEKLDLKARRNAIND